MKVFTTILLYLAWVAFRYKPRRYKFRLELVDKLGNQLRVDDDQKMRMVFHLELPRFGGRLTTWNSSRGLV